MTELLTQNIVIERHQNARGRFSPLKSMRVERGTKVDWDALHELHYKAENLPIAPKFWRCVTEEGDLVGVMVTSSVSLLSSPRHLLFPNLSLGGDTNFTNVKRGKWLNINFRRAARIVTDTMFRGVGISYRMVNLAMRMEQKRFVEIQSSMSKFNPFDLKAGFSHGHLRRAAAYDKGLAFFRTYFDSHPADHQAIMKEFNELPQLVQEVITKDLRAFYFRHSAKEKTGSNMKMGMRKIDLMSVSALIKELQQLIFASPVYGIWENPDLGRELPDSLPLMAFDLQPPNKPLRLDLL